MSIYRNGPEVQLGLPEHAPGPSQPLIRPLPLPEGATGRLYTAGLGTRGRPVIDGQESMVTLRVTEEGHWWLTTSCGLLTTCRGCGVFDDQLDGRCTKPPTTQQIASALLERVPRPAPARMRSHRIRFIRTEAAA